MAFWIAIVLGLVQGLTEFLPVSSSGDLVLLEKIFGVELDYTFLNVILHFATLLAVCWFYRKRLWQIVRHPFSKQSQYLIIATIPAILFVLMCNNFVESKLSSENAKVYASLPALIKSQLLADRDPHGNVQVSKIETEKLLIEMISAKLSKLKAEGKFTGKFSSQSHFFGYEGRCAFPSNFDADYCYSLGYNAFALINFGLTGYLSSVRNLTQPADEWIAGGIPLTMMMNMEKRHGEMKPVIQKALVKLDGPVFKQLEENREDWAMNDRYLFPGAIQYFGPSSVCDITTVTLQLERGKVLASV